MLLPDKFNLFLYKNLINVQTLYEIVNISINAFLQIKI